MKKLFVFLFLPLCFISSSFAASLQREDWPDGENCPTCFHLQIRNLEMQLPIAKIHGIFSTGVGASGIEIIPASGKLADSIHIIDRTQDELFDDLRKSNFLKNHQIKTIKDFFFAIGDDSKNQDIILTKLRKIYGLNEAEKYKYLEKNGLIAFIVNSEKIEDKKIFFVINEKKIYYEVTGNLSDEIMENILVNAKVVDMP